MKRNAHVKGTKEQGHPNTFSTVQYYRKINSDIIIELETLLIINSEKFDPFLPLYMTINLFLFKLRNLLKILVRYQIFK